MHKQLLLSVATALVLLQPTYSQATTPQPNAYQTTQQEAWLGVSLDTIPNILRSQLSTVIPAGQGVMIIGVIDNSPAAKAGLQKHDVILNSGDQKIYSPQQLTGMVKAAQAGSNLNLSIVRQGKVQNVSVVLGKQNKPMYPNWQRQWSPFGSLFGRRWQQPSFPNMQPLDRQGNRQSFSSWDSFESVQVRTLEDGRYHAEVKYKDPQGNEKSFAFEGKREEIIKQINEEKELPDAKKQALLNALNMDSGKLFNNPFFQGGSPFNDPFFRGGNSFNDPFFQRSFPRLNMPGFQPFFNNPSNRQKPIQQEEVF